MLREIALIIVLIITAIFGIIISTVMRFANGSSAKTGGVLDIDSLDNINGPYAEVYKYFPYLRTDEFWYYFYKVAGVRDNPPYMNFNDIPKTDIKYTGEKAFKMDTHIGQRKLLMSEIDFMNYVREMSGDAYEVPYIKYSDKSSNAVKDDPQSNITKESMDDIVVYAGACPGNHLGALLYLFPKMKIIAVDPSELMIYRYPAGIGSHFSEKDYALYFQCSDINVYPLQKGDQDKSVDFYNIGDDKIERFDYTNDEHRATQMNADKMTEEYAPRIRNIIKKTNYRVYYFGTLMTNELAEIFAPMCKYFWSDIRTKAEDLADSREGEKFSAAILANFVMQYEWSRILDAEFSMIKFRLPYSGTDPISHINDPELQRYDIAGVFDRVRRRYGLDYSQARDDKYLIPDGIIRLQTRVGYSSTEMRLIYRRYAGLREFDAAEMEDRLYFYNQIARTVRHCENKYADIHAGLCHCNDCAMEGVIMEPYKKKIDIKVFFKILDIIFKRSIKTFKHGFLQEPFTKEQYLNVAKNYIRKMKQIGKENRI